MLRYRTDGPIAWAELDRPEKLNAMTRSFWPELRDTLERADADSAVRVLIFHGAGKSFSVGGDIIACDIVVADSTARFATPEAAVGLFPGPGVARGAAHLNLHWLKFMVFTGEPLGAEEARLAGLVNRVTSEGTHLIAAAAMARMIAEQAPLALVHTSENSDRFGAYLQGTDDFTEGIKAFQQRRKPQFKGR